MKVCTYCKKRKRLSSFNIKKLPSGTLSTRSYCKKCGNVAAILWRKNHPELASLWDRNKRYKRDYGITEDQYQLMLKKQNGKCAICKSDSKKFKYRLHVDHNHESGKIRGLLCVRCNTGLGSLKNKASLIGAIKYLELNGE